MRPAPLLLFLFILAVLVSSVVPSPVNAQELQPHDPIDVNRDNDWVTCNCLSGGDGSPANPYIIEKYEITASPSTIDNGSIHISNTRSHFIIRNVYIHPATYMRERAGILFHNVQNGFVENVRIQNTQYGIWLALSENNVIIDNTAWNNTIGIYVTGGSRNTMTNNNASNNTLYGIWMTGASDNLVIGNTASNNQAGFVVGTSTNNTFTNNFASNNTDNTRRGYGFRILFSSGNTFRDNTVTLTPFALIFEFSSGNLATGNLLLDNDYGIGLERENTGNTITNNNATNNFYGIYVFNSPGNLIYNNYLRNNVNSYDDVSYPAKLTVTDSNSLTTKVGQIVTVTQSPPRIAAEFTFSPTSAIIGQEVSFTATATGTTGPYVFDWKFGDTASATGQTTTHTYMAAGLFQVTLDVTDSQSFKTTIRHYASVQSFLVADFTFLRGPGTSYTFTFTPTASGGTGPYTFSWDFDDGTTGTGNPVTHTYTRTSFTGWNASRQLATSVLGGPFLGGNYYSNYQGTDSDGDGIGDTPYSIPGGPNQDHLPLVSPVSSTVHDVAITGLSLQPQSVRVGGTFTITVPYSNRGTEPESFQITIFYDQIIIETRQITDLPPNTQGTLASSWYTGSVQPGSYQIRAEAATVPGETNTSNNNSPVVPVTVLPNQLPTATFTTTPQTAFLGNIVNFDATQSTDDGSITQYSWNFGDDNSAIGITTAHLYGSHGTFTVVLTVTDDYGATGTTSRQVVIRPNVPSAPTDLQLSAEPGKVTLQWSTPSENGGSPVEGYTIYRGESPSTMFAVAETGNVNSYVDTNVVNGRTYYYRVVAVNAVDEGQPSETKDVLVPLQGTLGSSPLPTSPLIIALLATAVAVTLAAALLFIRRKSEP